MFLWKQHKQLKSWSTYSFSPWYYALRYLISEILGSNKVMGIHEWIPFAKHDSDTDNSNLKWYVESSLLFADLLNCPSDFNPNLFYFWVF